MTIWTAYTALLGQLKDTIFLQPREFTLCRRMQSYQTRREKKRKEKRFVSQIFIYYKVVCFSLFIFVWCFFLNIFFLLAFDWVAKSIEPLLNKLLGFEITRPLSREFLFLASQFECPFPVFPVCFYTLFVDLCFDLRCLWVCYFGPLSALGISCAFCIPVHQVSEQHKSVAAVKAQWLELNSTYHPAKFWHCLQPEVFEVHGILYPSITGVVTELPPFCKNFKFVGAELWTITWDDYFGNYFCVWQLKMGNHCYISCVWLQPLSEFRKVVY